MSFVSHHWNYTLQHDSSRSHSARATINFLEQNFIDVMAWHSFSLGAYPIADLGDEIQRRPNEVQPRSTPVGELDSSSMWFGFGISMAFINRLIHWILEDCCNQCQWRIHTILIFVPHFFYICDILLTKIFGKHFRRLLYWEIYYCNCNISQQNCLIFLLWFSIYYYTAITNKNFCLFLLNTMYVTSKHFTNQKHEQIHWIKEPKHDLCNRQLCTGKA